MGYQGRDAYRQDGSLARSLMAYLGCCNIPRYPMALDPVRDLAYVLANDELFGANMSTGALSAHFYGAGDTFGMISISDSDTLYTAGLNGNVTRLHPANGRQWLRVDSTPAGFSPARSRETAASSSAPAGRISRARSTRGVSRGSHPKAP